MAVGPELTREDKEEKLGHFYLADMRRRAHSSLSSCYIVHERCWTIVTRVIDVELINKHLEIFRFAISQTLKKRRTNSLDHKRFYDDEEEWISREGERQGENELSLKEAASVVSNYSEKWRCDGEMFATRDPLRVADVWRSIEAEKARFDREMQEEDAWKDSSLERRKQSHPMQKRRSPRLHRTTGLNVPPEVVLEILDHLPDSQQIRQLMSVFPYWAPGVPNSYWRRRFIQEVMLEDEEEEVPAADTLNWRRLYYKTESIHRDSHGLRNRRRIFANANELKVVFEKLLLMPT